MIASFSSPAYSRAAAGIVDRTRSYHDNEAIVQAVEDVYDLAARVENGVRSVIGDGYFFLKKNGRKDDPAGFDSEVVCGVSHGRFLRILAMGGFPQAGGSEGPPRPSTGN